MSITSVPQKEQDRVIYNLILEGKIMTAAELREKSGFTKGQIQSSLVRLSQNGYIEIANKDRKRASTWRVK